MFIILYYFTEKMFIYICIPTSESRMNILQVLTNKFKKKKVYL